MRNYHQIRNTSERLRPLKVLSQMGFDGYGQGYGNTLQQFNDNIWKSKMK